MIADAVYNLLFYVFAATMIVLSLAVTISMNLLRAAIYLMGVLLLSAGCYVMLGAEFIAGIQVLIYVGGIVVLIVFAIMLTHSVQDMPEPATVYRHLSAAAAAIIFCGTSIWVFLNSNFNVASGADAGLSGSAQAIGRKLLDRGGEGYLLPFEIISVLLLAAAIGSIVVARKTPPPGEFTACDDDTGKAAEKAAPDEVLEPVGGSHND